MRMDKVLARLIGLIGFCVCVAGALPAHAQNSVEQFYRGKTVTILIGHPAGGSYDLYARLAASHLGRFIPGHPQILVQSRPGGSGAGAVQFLYGFGPRDGTLLGLFTETVGLIQLSQPEIGKWRVQDFAYLGSFANVNSAFMMRKDSPAKTVEDMRHTETKVGCNSRLGQSYVNYAVLKAYGGFKFHIVCGYPGSMEYSMALARGEVDMISGAWNAWRRRPDVLDGSFRAVIQSGLKRHRELADVPLMQELLDDPRHKQVAEFLSSASTIGRSLLVHEAVPAAWRGGRGARAPVRPDRQTLSGSTKSSSIVTRRGVSRCLNAVSSSAWMVGRFCFMPKGRGSSPTILAS
jgi:tripartite-type tricarboxylate transporter receptor subunit TctC